MAISVWLVVGRTCWLTYILLLVRVCTHTREHMDCIYSNRDTKNQSERLVFMCR